MIFRELAIPGVYVVEQDVHRDERGHFRRFFCTREYESRGLDPRIAQCSVSFNERRGTLRGMHYQAEPHEEAKTVRCLQGAIYDVVVDLRPGSPTRLRWVGIQLDARTFNALYVPAGLAHGFITLEDATAVEYLISTYYEPSAARGIRHDDPQVGITWPFPPQVISERDRTLPLAAELGGHG